MVFAVDNYQALHSPSTYGEKRTAHSRRRLDPGELRVASAMRVLDGPPPAWGVDVAALTWSEGYHAERDSVSAAAQVSRITLGLWHVGMAACQGLHAVQAM